MNKEFEDFMDEWRTRRLTALGAVLGCKPLPDIGRCGESAESELNKAGTDAQATSGFYAPSLSNEQRPSNFYVCVLCKRVSERLFSCDHCEGGNRLCMECFDSHQAAGHESDSSTAQHYHQGIHIVGGRNED